MDGEPGAVWIFAQVILGSDGLGEFGYAIAKVYYGVDVGSDLHLGDRAGFLQVGGGGLGAKGAVDVSLENFEGIAYQIFLKQQVSFGGAAEAVKGLLAIVHLDGGPRPGGIAKIARIARIAIIGRWVSGWEDWVIG